ncbi:MAG: hypothetical protein ACRDOG_05105 [Gaiellaceae bacterium]
MEEDMLSTPDVTPAQVIAVVGAVIGVLAAAGLPLSAALQDSIITLVTVLAPLVIIGDAHIRHGRSRALAIPPRPIEEEEQVGA